MALDALYSLNFAMAAPAGTPVQTPKTLNPTNHMPQTKVGAFILPSLARISLLPLHPIRTCDDQRQTAMKYDLDHFDRALLAKCTNRLLDCGTSADRSTTARPLGRRSSRTSGDGRWTLKLLAARTTNSGEPAKLDDFSEAVIFPPGCLPSTDGASFATYSWVSSGSGRSVAR
jgi:hypothetical protein